MGIWGVAADAGDRIRRHRLGRCHCSLGGGVPQRPQRGWLRRRQERDDRVSLAGGPLRTSAGTDDGTRRPSRGYDRHAREHSRRAGGQSGDFGDSDRLRRRRRPGQAWSCREPVAPRGNATGVNFFVAEVVAKRLGLLHDLVPAAARIAVMVNPANAALAEATLRALKKSTGMLGLQIQVFEASTSREIDAGFAAIARERADALFVGPDAYFHGRRVQFVTLAARNGIPANYSSRDYPEVGGLMSYDTDNSDSVRQVGVYAGKILNGAKPADLPVIQSTKFEFVINVQTARALGLTVPSSLLARADEVIE